MIKENKLINDFKLPSSNKKEFHLNKSLKQDLILYIYPKNNTPGCTSESIDFAKNYKKFKKLKIDIIGISKDSVESHIEFKKKFKLPFQLLSDVSTKVIKKLGAWGVKSMYGKQFEGTKRTTILIKKNRKIIKIWQNVKVKSHVEDVLDFIKINKF
jgi:peroxiredoxin Q/BCP